MTLAELKKHLADMTEMANAYEVEANANHIALKAWRLFTPQAIEVWGMANMLQFLGVCLEPPDPNYYEEILASSEEDDAEH